MAYNLEKDSYTCANEKKLTVTGTRRCKTKTGYVSEKTQYGCTNCKGCPRKAECIRAGTSKTPLEKRSKWFEVAKEFQEQRAKALARITSPDGIELRVKWSIQAEGAFEPTKENLSFRRFLSHGRKNILVEAMLLAMAHNMICLHHKIQAGKEVRYLFPVTVAA